MFGNGRLWTVLAVTILALIDYTFLFIKTKARLDILHCAETFVSYMVFVAFPTAMLAIVFWLKVKRMYMQKFPREFIKTFWIDIGISFSPNWKYVLGVTSPDFALKVIKKHNLDSAESKRLLGIVFIARGLFFLTLARLFAWMLMVGTIIAKFVYDVLY